MEKNDIQSVFAKNDLTEYLANFYQIRVVYYADQEVDNMCRKLTGCSMPEKFSVFIDNAYVRDISGTTAGNVQRRIGFRFIDARSIADYNRKKYDEVIKEWFDDESNQLTTYMCSGVGHAYSSGLPSEKGLKLMSTMADCPWYSSYRAAIMETNEASEVEFMSSCISCVFLTAETAENPSNNLVNLAKQHDERSSIRMSGIPQNASPATPMGPSRHLLMPCPRCCGIVFAPSSSSTDGAHLNAPIEQARATLPGLLTQPIPFVPIENTSAEKPSTIIAGLFARLARDVVLPSLLQWSERHITQLADQLNSRRGLSTQLRTIFSTGSKTSSRMPARGSSGNLIGANGQTLLGSSADVVYTDESSEIQLRRLSDLAMLMGALDIAFEGYHRLKDDFQRDQALLPQATALEAAAVALLLHPQPSSKRYPTTCLKYLDNALSLYQSLSSAIPRAQYLAVRCGLLYADTLRSLRMFPEAAAVFAKLAPENPSRLAEFELRSAVALEQAAHCWAGLRPTPRMRKAALNLLLAGARYSNAGRRRHALRCYQNALPTYAGKGLALAEDHVLLTIGRQSFALRDLRTAVEAFAGLLCHNSDTKNKHQSAVTQAGFIREYLYVAKRYQDVQAQAGMAAAENVVIAPVPVFPSTFLLSDPNLMTQMSDRGISTPGPDDWQIFASLEEAAVKALINFAVFRHATFFFTSKIRGKHSKLQKLPSVFANEEFALIVDVENPLDIPLILQNMAISGFIDTGSDSPQLSDGLVRGKYAFGHGEVKSFVKAESPVVVDLPPRQHTSFVVKLTCLLAGKLTINVLCAQLSTALSSDDHNPSVVHAHWPMEAPWSVDVYESSACVRVGVQLSETPTSYIPGTLVPMKVNFRLSNVTADHGVNCIVLSTNRSDCFQLLDGFSEVSQPPAQTTQSSTNSGAVDTTKSWRIIIPQSAAETSTWSVNSLVRVAPNAQEIASSLFAFNLLVAYEPAKKTGKRRYRLSPMLVKLPLCETPFLLSVASTPHPASPVGLLNVRDCERFSVGFSASLMTQSPASTWTGLQLCRLALISCSIVVESDSSKNTETKSSTRIVSTTDVSRRSKRLPHVNDPANLDLLSHCTLSTVIGSEPVGSAETRMDTELFQAIIRMGISAHRNSVFSSASSASRLHGIFVFQWKLLSKCETQFVQGCNFVVDPPLFASDQFSSAVYAASDPSISARRLAFGMTRDSTVSTTGFSEGNLSAPIVVHLEYPQSVEIKTEDHDDQTPYRISASVFCRNRSSLQVEVIDCNLQPAEHPGSKDDIGGLGGLLWLAPQPAWPLMLQPGEAVSFPLVLLATHSGVFRPHPPSIDYVAPPNSNKASVRPDYGPFIQVRYLDT